MEEANIPRTESNAIKGGVGVARGFGEETDTIFSPSRSFSGLASYPSHIHRSR